MILRGFLVKTVKRRTISTGAYTYNTTILLDGRDKSRKYLDVQMCERDGYAVASMSAGTPLEFRAKVQQDKPRTDKPLVRIWKYRLLRAERRENPAPAGTHLIG